MRYAPLLILVLAYSVVGQEVRKATLIDEFFNVHCDEYLARADNFLISLSNEPNSRGYAVISGSSPLRRRLAYELWLNDVVTTRKFDLRRIIFVRGSETESAGVRFWLVPTGTEPPKFEERKWNFVFPPKTKPYIFWSEMEQICWSSNFASPYKEYLDANQGSRGHVVIYAGSRRNYRKTLKETQEKLKSIPSKRIRFFYVWDNSMLHDSSYAEYWLVPRKK